MEGHASQASCRAQDHLRPLRKSRGSLCGFCLPASDVPLQAACKSPRLPAERSFSSLCRDFGGLGLGGSSLSGADHSGHGQVSEHLFQQLDHLIYLVFVFWASGKALVRIYSRQMLGIESDRLFYGFLWPPEIIFQKGV